jgi:secreted PhoX family phosphatase
MLHFHTGAIAVARRKTKMNQSIERDEESAVGSNAWERQALQVVMSHEGMTFLPIDGNPRHGLLVIQHACADDGWLRGDGMRSRSSQGESVVEVFERLGQWWVMPRSRKSSGQSAMGLKGQNFSYPSRFEQH